MNSNLNHPSLLSATARVATRSALLSLAVFVSSALAQSVEPVKLNWLDGHPPAIPQSVSWGVPWPKGQVQKSDSLVLKAADGKVIPAQTWPLAYWPDGSVMWSGSSIVATPDMAGPLQLAVGAATAPAAKIVCTQDDRAITIDTGAIKVRLPKSGSNLVESISIGDRKIAQDGKLVCRLEDRSNYETTKTTPRRRILQPDQDRHARTVGPGPGSREDRGRPPVRFHRSRVAAVRGAALLQRRPGFDPDRPFIRLR
jgi:hypothetical protein